MQPHASSNRATLLTISLIGLVAGFIAVNAASDGSGGVFVAASIIGVSAFGLGTAGATRSQRAVAPTPLPFTPPQPPLVAPSPARAPAPPPPSPPTVPPPAQPPPPPTVVGPASPHARRPSLRNILARFVSAHAILLLSYLGAFLLIVSALLFLLYGPQDLPGGARLATVAGVNAILALAAFVCRRRASVRLVATSYTALAALMTPLTLAAAYEFVLRHATPLNGVTAVSLAAGACALLYGLLARALVSRSYASLALVASATSAVAAAIALGTGPMALPAGAAYTALCLWIARSGGRAFAFPASIAGHLVAAATVGAAIGFAAYDGFSGPPPYAAYLPLSLAALAAVYAGAHRLARHDAVGDAVAVLLVSAAAITASQTLGYGADGAAGALLVTGFATVALSQAWNGARSLLRWTAPAAWLRLGLAALATAELVAIGLSPIAHPLVQTLALPLTVVGGALLAIRGRSWWALPAGPTALVLQIAVQQPHQVLLPVAPAYVAATLFTAFGVCSLIALSRRTAAFVLAAATTMVLATLAGGSTLGWNADEFAIAIAGLTVIFVAGGARLGMAAAWITSSTAVIAGLFTMSDPALQVAVLGVAVACGLALAIRRGNPAWLVTGLAALAMQSHVNAAAIAGAAPLYVPTTLALVMLATIIDGTIRRDRLMGVPAALLLIAATLTAGSTLRWQADAYAVALAAVAAVCAVVAWLAPVRVPVAAASAWRGLNNAGAWIAAAAVVSACGIITGATATPFVVVGVAIAIGLGLTAATRSPWWLLTGVVAVLADATAHAPAIAAAGVLPAYVPVAFAGVLGSIAAVGLVTRNRVLIVAADLCLAAAVLTANSAASLGVAGYAIELVGLAYLAAVTAPLARDRALVWALRIGAGVRLVVAAAIVVPSPWAEAALMGGAALCAAWLAAGSRLPEWTFLAAALLAWAWYWGAAAAGATHDPVTTVNAFSPLPFVYGGVAVLLSRALPRRDIWRWVLAPAVFGGVAAAGIDTAAGAVLAWTTLSWSLFTQGLVVYALARIMRITALVPVSAAPLTGAAITVLLALNAPLIAYPLAIAVVAWMFRGAAWATARSDTGGVSMDVHRWTALGIAAVAVATPIVNSAFVTGGAPATMAELAASLSLAVLVAAGISTNVVRDRCAAVVAASFALEWLPVFFGVREPQAYVTLPAVVLAACGVLALHDARLGLDRISAYAVIAAGAGAALLTTLVQMAGAGETSVYTGVLLVEGVACAGVAIAARVRLLAVIGGGAVAAAAIRALITAVAGVPLYAVFGVAALLLMVLATVLATQRARLHDARESLRDAWAAWD